MIKTEKFISYLTKKKIDFFCGVPDSTLNNFLNALAIRKKRNIIAANEGGAVALAMGHYLDTKRVPLVYMQNLGLGNATDPLTSLCAPEVYSIPMVLLIGWRGNPHMKDEPQHLVTGRNTLNILRLFKIKTVIIDDHSKEENLDKIKDLIKNEDINIIPLNHNEYETSIKKQKSTETFSNLASLLKSFEIGKQESEDLIFFVEDDYLHFESMLEEMIASYERISSQIGKDIFMCPSDYPYLYMNNEKTNILIGSKRHWRSIDKTLCTFLTSKNLLGKYWGNFYNTCIDRHEPFEKYINEIYQKELCISPIKSLSLHLTNINSSYGLAPFIDYKKLWDENN